MKKHLVVLTGAGVSAESGLKTFRDNDGLWAGHDINEVASPDGWRKNPQLVLDFYNKRRTEVSLAQPNIAHKILAELQHHFQVSIVTQNIDDLHERAGSDNVLHLHGEIFKMKSILNDNISYEIRHEIFLGDLDENGHQFRPDIVWFGEPVPKFEQAVNIMQNAEVFILIGSSLQVYPAASLINYVNSEVPKYIIDKKIPECLGQKNLIPIQDTATSGILKLKNILLSEFK